MPFSSEPDNVLHGGALITVLIYVQWTWTCELSICKLEVQVYGQWAMGITNLRIFFF